MARHEQKLADLEQRNSELEPSMRARARWETQHGTDLERLDILDRQIDVTERLDRVVSRTTDRGVDHGIDIGM